MSGMAFFILPGGRNSSASNTALLILPGGRNGSASNIALLILPEGRNGSASNIAFLILPKGVGVWLADDGLRSGPNSTTAPRRRRSQLARSGHYLLERGLPAKLTTRSNRRDPVFSFAGKPRSNFADIPRYMPCAGFTAGARQIVSKLDSYALRAEAVRCRAWHFHSARWTKRLRVEYRAFDSARRAKQLSVEYRAFDSARRA
jgi:hypothetical protein